ncbi:hypothetical protein Tco_0790949 [Tanacetum coccineum]
MPYDSPLPRGHTLGSNEGRMQQHELMDLVTKLSDRCKALETDLRQTKKVYGFRGFFQILENDRRIDQDARVSLVTPTHSQEDQPEDQLGVFSAAKVLADAAKNVHTYTRIRRAVSTGSGGVSTASRLVSTAGASMPVSIVGIVQEVNKDKGKGIMTESEPEQTKTKLQQRQERAGYEAAHMGSHTLQQLKRLSFDELKALFETTMIRVQTFHPIESEGDKTVPELTTRSSKMDAEVELDHEGSKKQKTNKAPGSVQEQPEEEEETELSQEDLQQMMMVVPVEEIYVEALQKFDRDDQDKLWSLVKERFSSTDPTDDKERTLWVELKRLFEPDTDDIMLKLQRYMHDPLTWRLYDTCGVHHVSTDKGHNIFMLVEKDYPLTRGLLTLMLCNKLQVDQYSEMADELLRKIVMLANKPRQ